jgi:hypothetical protein
MNSTHVTGACHNHQHIGGMRMLINLSLVTFVMQRTMRKLGHSFANCLVLLMTAARCGAALMEPQVAHKLVVPAWALCRLCLNRRTHARQIRAALGRWDGSGAFVFTGSAGVYAEDGGGPCPEEGPVVGEGHSERTDRRALARCSPHAQHSMPPGLARASSWGN